MARFPHYDSPTGRDRVQWETWEITMPAGTTRQEAKTVLTQHAEREQWELARLRLFSDGRRWALLRRRKYRIVRPAWIQLGAQQ